MDRKKGLPFGITIKTEPGTSESTASQRLPSLRPPRDLSLSAFGQRLPPNLLGNQSKSKKVYIPNLNVQRNKSAEDSIKSEQVKGKGKLEARNQKPEDRGRGKKVLIQTGSGLFAAGLAPSSKSTLRKSHGGGDETGEKGEALQKPKLKLQENIKINKEEEEATMKNLLRDDFIDDPSLEPDYDNCPVKLPLVDWKVFNVDQDERIKMKEGDPDRIKVKTEPGLLEECKPDDKKSLSIPDLFKSSTTNDVQYIFLQLPNCMPGLKPEVETPRPGQKPSSSSSVPSTAATSTSEGETKVEDTKCLLSNLSPGCIGKLQILKSGRARLVLGDIKLTVQLGTQVAFKQDLISCNLDSGTYTGDMINLGPVTTRMIISPDWEDMLLQQMHI